MKKKTPGQVNVLLLLSKYVSEVKELIMKYELEGLDTQKEIKQ